MDVFGCVIPLNALAFYDGQNVAKVNKLNFMMLLAIILGSIV
jgi:hypothetical protein